MKATVMSSATLRKWINPCYLLDRTINDIIESVKARPILKYVVLDNFFREELLDEMIERHAGLDFDERTDRQGPDGTWLPYDSSVQFAGKSHFGADLFFDRDWHAFCAYLVGTILRKPGKTDVKLRYHRPDANGFWIHTDSAERSIVIISYFNKGWRAADGGLLQLWRIDECSAPDTPTYDGVASDVRLDMLSTFRLRTGTPGGGFPDGAAHDLVLIDQIVPAYNRLFICDFQTNKAYHSVTPSNGKARTGFVQWLY